MVGRRYCVIRCTVGSSSSRSVLFCIWQDCNQKALMHFAFSPTFVPHPRYSTLDSSINSSINEECFYLNLFAVLTFILFIPIIIQARLLWILHWEWRLILYSCFDLHSETGTTDTQRELFFENLKGRQIGPKFWGAFRVFSAILVLWVPVPCPVFHESIIISTKKLSLYIQIFIWDLNLSRKELGI